jgi:hypothetical protein
VAVAVPAKLGDQVAAEIQIQAAHLRAALALNLLKLGSLDHSGLALQAVPEDLDLVSLTGSAVVAVAQVLLARKDPALMLVMAA